jgi:nucleoside-diphosphate-sugar epimerase
MSKKILVTGINGFTGLYFSAGLAAQGHEVHGLVRQRGSQMIPGCEVIHEADLADPVAMARVVDHVRPDRVAHLAGISFVAHGDAQAIYNINVLGTRNLLEALVAAGSKAESVLLASSANVYGNSTKGVLDEETPAAPVNDYAVSKIAMEYLASLYAGRLPIVITRPFNYTGVGQAESFLVPKIVAHVKRGAQSIELGSLDVARDFSDVRMVVQAYMKLMDEPAAIGKTFNVCSGKAHTIAEVLALVRDLSGRSFEVQVNPTLVRSNEVKSLLGSRAKLEACVGKLDQFELHDTLRWMLEN